MAEKTEIIYEKQSIFKRIGRGFKNFFAKSLPGFFTKSLPGFFVNIGRGIKNFCVTFGKRFVDGSVGTKISHLICGAGNLYHGQIIKGLIFLALQVGFVLFMVLCPAITGPNGIQVPTGYKALANLVLQGNESSYIPAETGGGAWTPEGQFIPASNSFLMLLLGLVTIAVIILYIIIWLSNIKSSYVADTAVKEGRKPSSFVDDLKALLDNRFHILMLTPTCIAALVFTLLPTILMICLAFTTYNQTDMNTANTVLFHWNGITNFSDIFKSGGSSTLGVEIAGRFLPVLGWTFIWAILATFSCYFGGILLAVLINKKGLKGKKVFRTIFILTIAIPQFISLLTMRNLFMSNGPINHLIVDVFHWSDEAIGFLGQKETDSALLAQVMVILINMWLGIPYTMLMTSGILMNIPADLYEAARVDGTSRPKMFFKITLPYVIFITTPYLISSFVGNINSFNTIFLLTGGGPAVVSDNGTKFVAGKTDLLVTWLYKLTIDNGDFNTGAVIGIFTFLITATITLVTYRRSKAYNEEDTFQ